MKTRIVLVVLFALQCVLTSLANAASAPVAAPTQCFDDWQSVQWGPNDQGMRAQTLLFCAQMGAATLAVLDAVDKGRVPQAQAGQSARELAFAVMTGALTEVDGSYQAPGQRAPTPDQFRAYIGDNIDLLRAKRQFLQTFVAIAWQSPMLSGTAYPAASKRIVAQWVAAH